MNPIKARPLLGVCGGLALGLAAPDHWILCCLLLGIFLICLPWKFAIAGFFALGVVLHKEPPPEILESRPYKSLGRIVSVPKDYGGFQTGLLETELGLFKLEAEHTGLISLGDEVRVNGTLRPLKEQEVQFYRTQGCFGTVRAKSLEVVRQGPYLYRLGGMWRSAFIEFCARTLPERAAPIVDALCFNVDWWLEDETRDQLRATGTVHIISASGLHVIILAAGMQWILARLPVGRHWQLVILALILLVYAGAAGLRPPIVRAGLMSIIGLSAYLFRRESDWMTALAASALVYLVFVPQAIYDIGFQLSYTTVAAISMFVPNLDWTKPGLVERALLVVRSGFQVGLAAAAGSAPLIAYHFGNVSLISPVANLAIAPSVAIIIIPAMAAFFMGMVIPLAAQVVMSAFVIPGVKYLLTMLAWFSSIPFAEVQVPGFNGIWLVPLYAGMLLLWRERVRKA
ncbi:MAG TPA: ComEC/Rec2 family competence protein [Fimbriimonadaceae bacterium]|nr:ComEC/Rec2 family competence protein [Fimbriimonadaceae bacterium]